MLMLFPLFHLFFGGYLGGFVRHSSQESAWEGSQTQQQSQVRVQMWEQRQQCHVGQGQMLYLMPLLPLFPFLPLPLSHCDWTFQLRPAIWIGLVSGSHLKWMSEVQSDSVRERVVEVENGARGLVRGTLFFDVVSRQEIGKVTRKKLSVTLQCFLFFSCWIDWIVHFFFSLWMQCILIYCLHLFQSISWRVPEYSKRLMSGWA